MLLGSNKVKISGTHDRTIGYNTPSVSEDKCPYFYERFIKFGARIPENRAICEKHDDSLCDYRKVVNGVPMCLRYWYGPLYEEVQTIPPPKIHKKNENGQKLYFDPITMTETTFVTGLPIENPIHDIYPVGSISDPLVQKVDAEGNLQFWDYTVIPPQLTITPNDYPAYEYGNMIFYSTQYIDTHNKVLKVSSTGLEWKANE